MASLASVTDPDVPAPLPVIMARRLAHALRTPVGVVDGVLAEIGSAPAITADPTLASFATLGRRSMRQLLEIAERLDWVARAERVAHEPTVTLSWPELLHRAVEEGTEGRRERERKRISLVTGEELGEGRAHREASERAIFELADNALRHARTVVEVIADVEDDMLRVRVADDGPGLPKGAAGAFAPPQEPGPRMGIGLWLVERLAHAMRGRVAVDRTGPSGTVMALHLPLQATETPPDETKVDETTQG